MSNNLFLFVDFVGRTIIGELAETTKPGSICIKNPAIVHIQPVKQGQVQVQIIPYMIPEFIAAEKRKDPLFWFFPENAVITPLELTVDQQLVNQYNRIFSPIIVPETAPVINLFSDEKQK